MAAAHYLTARLAAEALGVTPATLYAYASRGQVRSEAVPGHPRERRYYREDIERLQERKAARRDPARAAARALHWGGPALESAITFIHDGRFYYRGHDAVTLADTATLEEAALLLWAAEEPERDRLFQQRCALPPRSLAQLRTFTKDPFTRVQIALPIAATIDSASYNLRPSAVRQSGARIVRLLTAAIAEHDSPAPVHRTLQAAWRRRADHVGEAIRMALVLCADHEVNVSAFTARCAASAGASPYDVVSAALAALKGYKHGGAAERVLGLFAEADTPKKARAMLASRLRRGDGVPGFGHPLYPRGDPRAVVLMRLAEASGDAAAWPPVRNLSRAGSELLHDHPNLDFGLAALARTHRLPDHAPRLLFALGRTIGWIAHAMEEYASGELIRPRARYTGPLPEGESQ
jgi:citrate synthase